MEAHTDKAAPAAADGIAALLAERPPDEGGDFQAGTRHHTLRVVDVERVADLLDTIYRRRYDDVLEVNGRWLKQIGVVNREVQWLCGWRDRAIPLLQELADLKKRAPAPPESEDAAALRVRMETAASEFTLGLDDVAVGDEIIACAHDGKPARWLVLRRTTVGNDRFAVAWCLSHSCDRTMVGESETIRLDSPIHKPLHAWCDLRAVPAPREGGAS